MFKTDGLVRKVALPAAIALLVLAAIVGAILHVSTAKSNTLAVERQKGLVAIGLAQSIQAIAHDQEASTFWDDAVLRMRERPLDLEWIDNNLGVWFHTFYKHDEAYLLGPRDVPVYAMQDGRRAETGSFDQVAAPTLPLAQRLRRDMRDGYEADSGASGQTAGASDVLVLRGRPAVVSVKPIVSETGDIAQQPGSEYLHVAVRYLDRSFLESLSRQVLIDEPRFQWKPAGEASLPIRSSQGRIVGHFTWRQFAPGSQVREEMTPVLFVALTLVGALVSLLLWRIQRSRMDLEASRAEAEHLAFHDSLTGLPNRALFEDRMDQALRQRRSRIATLLLDLDRFKNVNDTLGHQAGDELIRQFGQRLMKLTRAADTISRLGGDEFAILVVDARPADIDRLARRILDDVRQPFGIGGVQAYVGVSIGIAHSAPGESDRDQLLRRADIALYQAKDAGRNGFRLFNPAMDESVMLRSRLEEELRVALDTGEGLCVHFQPLVAADGKIAGVEALLRWEREGCGFVSPAEFVPIAEETGLIVRLGEWVLLQACLAAARWPHLFVAVNLSPIQFRGDDFFDRLMEIVRGAGAEPSRIQLEVTECVLLDDDDRVKGMLASLRAAGFVIVLDDFGTGYSSLSYLRKFEVDKIKIDQSFVQHLDEADSRAIVTALLALGHGIGLTVAAEGVETAEQRLFLQIAGCTEMQGHYFSAALPEAELARLLADPPVWSAAA